MIRNMKTVLIYSGFNPRAILAFLRFAKQRNISCVVIAQSDNDFIFHTDYRDKIIHVRKSSTLNADKILSHVELVRKKFNIHNVFILPSTEYLNRILINNKELLFKYDVTFGLCDKDLYEKISDKEAFTNLCRKYNIPVPLQSPIPLTSFPQVAKPKTYFEGSEIASKPVLIKSQKELLKFKSNNQIASFFYQEYINGQCVYLLFYFEKNGRYSVFSQENFIQQSNGASMILAKSSNYHNNQDIVKPYVNMFLSEKFVGLVMVEIIIQNNISFMIEANPRLWGPSQLILDAGMNLFDFFICDNEILEKCLSVQNYQENVFYFWSGGIVETQKKKEQIKFHNYTPTDFTKNYSEITKRDIYLKKDSIKLHIKENS